MSSHGWSGEGLGEEAEEGLSGWAPPLETETPPPVEIREDEDEEQAGRPVEDDAGGRTPTGGGSSEGSERGTPRRTEPRVEIREARRDGGTLRSEPLSPRARRMAESVLDTPRGREMFNQFLARLARQPAPSEEPAPARMMTGATADAVTPTPRARQRDAFSYDASRPSLPLVGEMQGEVPTVTPAGAALNARGTTRHTPPRVGERHDVARTPYPEGGTPRRQGGTPAGAAETPTRRAGTPASDSALQETLVNTFSRALQRLSDSAGTPTRTPQPAEARPVSRPVPASSGNAFVDQTRPVSTPMLGYQGSMAPRMALPAPASTPVGMPMAAIPSYGGVTIQAPSTSRNDGRDGAARLGALYPPFQPPITPTTGWNSGGTLPAWSAAPATQTPASMGGLGLGRSFGGQERGYSMHSAYPPKTHGESNAWPWW
ncbi:hypothetical protein F442_22527 [Phytophthora nicotianae P10297]|uniref:G-patch domain-containing protein n=1 Tax=Phytophthora nicotianae P10297 TaxID=1317064 RepID=W2Y1Y5_PHYNI|nr:hypothetical protein F442_22527 [Phytophthora nicotianae P10297]